MNKLIKSVVLAGLVLASLMLMGFADVPEDHWAYSAVTRLSEEGSVSGFKDGSFRPNDPVTRAQFVKMLGYTSSQVRSDSPADLESSHWAYDYLMHSPLRTKDGLILPDTPVTREDTAVYLFDCFGNADESLAPSVVTKDSSYTTEVGWAYSRGLMSGSDGIDLRLSDGLTRAEAAVLISNAKDAPKTVDFADKVPDSVLKQVFDGSGLFDVEYSRDSVLTNGQIARAAYRLRLDRTDALWYDDEADFDHVYANDLKAMEGVIGSGRISAAFADAPAQPEDAFGMLSYGMASKIHIPVGYGNTGNYYKDASLKSSSLDAPLTFAYENGIFPFGGGRLNSGVPVTHKVIAAVLLQYDCLWGLHTSVTVDGTNVTYKDEPMSLEQPVGNGTFFISVPRSVPSDVSGLSFADGEGKDFTPNVLPKDNFPFFNDLMDSFADQLSDICRELKSSSGCDVSLTYYPQLVYNRGMDSVVRVKAVTNGSPQKVFEGLRLYTDSEGGSWVEIPLSLGYFLE